MPNTLYCACEEEWHVHEKDAKLLPRVIARGVHTGGAAAAHLAEESETAALGDINEMRPLRGPDAGCHSVTVEHPRDETCGLGLYARRRRANTEELQHPSEELRDLMNLCKVAH